MASMVQDLVDAGIHFGHRATNWNPKMAPYIFGKRNRIHIIDVRATIKGLLLARKFLTKTVASGKDVLFVGTKRQARSIIEQHVSETGMHWVTERWLGGTLTNFRTIRERLKRLEELEALEATGEIQSYSKKMESQLRRERTKIFRNLNGIRNMTKLPGVMVVIDVSHETNAVKEARKLGIPTVALIDTDSNPDFADIPIPGNDDAMRAIEVIMQSLCAAVMEGKNARAIQMADKDKANAGGAQQQQRRGSNRAMFKAETSAPGTAPAAATDAGAPSPAPEATAPTPPAAETPAPESPAAPETPDASAGEPVEPKTPQPQPAE